ncbi:MAG: DUF3800 domain-containing protein, partial [Verrucomicrobiae bacterium]|nr:DUF3800 domain-containing protein [Verrucomicrobiae bacterium]
LGLIQKNLYGLDIQPLASLIAKLRFFLTLVIEQEVNPADRDHNYGLQSLPNLETNFLCCNSLKELRVGTDLFDTHAIEQYIKAREQFYSGNLSQDERTRCCYQIAEILHGLMPDFSQSALGVPRIADKATAKQQNVGNLERWFRNATIPAPFFSTRAFFPEIGEGGFHIVIGNPPYGGTKIPDEVRETLALGSKDPYGAFIARFMGAAQRPSPLAPDGVLTYIVSDTFMTIKTHRPLREQLLDHRIHKMIRVAGDTFKAVVNCAVILCQRGAASEEHTCQMADLTNVSIWEQHERFLHLLYQTEGFARRQNVANQTYAIYHYRQSLIRTNSNLPFFVASPKLFALMRDTGNETLVNEKGLPAVGYNVSLNDHDLRVFKLGDQYTGMGRTRRWLNRGLFQVVSGIKTGSNAKYLRLLSDDAQKSFQTVDASCFLEDEEAIELPEDQKLNGITGKRCFVRFEMGMPADTDSGLLPCYYQPLSQIAINWSHAAVASMRAEGHSDLANAEYRFRPFDEQISFSFAGQYCPTFRRANAPIFLNAASRIFLRQGFSSTDWLGVLNSKLFRYITRELINHSVNFGVDDIKEFPALIDWKEIGKLAARILKAQERNSNYDYPSNEQQEIDRLVYAAYGLNEADIREVEDWYVRRYPRLAGAQRRALAAKQGKTEEQLTTRTTLHLYCDESRHLPYDREPFLLLGLLACPAARARELNQQLTALWKTHGQPQHFEAKWTKVSPAKVEFYRAALAWFIAAEDVTFRCVILPDKQRLYAKLSEENRDFLYYRLYYQFLRGAIEPENRHRVFLDLKDTRGREKIVELKRRLADDADDAKAVESLQHVHSHEIRLLQVTDLLLGAVGFARRPAADRESSAKRALVKFLEEELGHPLTADSPPDATKAILATWHDPDALLL